MSGKKVGIASIGIHLPPMFVSVKEIAQVRNIDPDKYTVGLGCDNVAICPRDYSVFHLGVEAAKRALSRWDGDIKDIGLLAVGTETALDMSRPLSNYIAEELNLQGHIRSYEVKHACYGGTVAIRQAVEWKLSGVSRNKAALIICVDESLYAQGDPGEPTQGAGAIAFIIDEPKIAEIEPMTYSWCKPVFDFWRPVGDAYPSVDGKFSVDCYIEAAVSCFDAVLAEKGLDLKHFFKEYHALCFHCPFPKMVQKAFIKICGIEGIPEEEATQIFREKVSPTLAWNLLSGNSYTASLWIGVAKALAGLEQGKAISAFSYGSGCGAELLFLKAGNMASRAPWEADIKLDIATREELTGEEYVKVRG